MIEMYKTLQKMYEDLTDREIEHIHQIETYQEDIATLEQQLKEYKDMYYQQVMKINTALEYIESNQYDKEIIFTNKKYYSEYFKNKIIEILKGVNNG